MACYWNNAGRPSSGLIHQIKVSSKLKYKPAINSALLAFENKHDDELYLNFLDKKVPDFLKCWSRKSNKHISNNVYIMVLAGVPMLPIHSRTISTLFTATPPRQLAQKNNLKICILISII